MLSLLLIEDDEIEAIKFERIIHGMDEGHAIRLAKNGEDAFHDLKEKANLPDLILLDLNMPKMNGVEFLEHIKQDRTLTHIPIVILTTSKNVEDVKRCYQIGIAGYIMKPLKYGDYKEKIHKIISYWNTNELANK